MRAEENKNYEEPSLLIPSVEETKKRELITLLANLITNYANKEKGKE